MYHFIVNPAARSGHGMEVWEQIQPVLEARQIPYRLLCSMEKGGITSLCRQVTAETPTDEDGLHRLVIVGGEVSKMSGEITIVCCEKALRLLK